MGDKRTDPGHYYPGGRVRAKSGTAPQELIVQWSDVQGKPQIAPLPDRYREDDMKGKINEIASRLATALAVALVGWTAFAGVVVQKARMGSLWNDDQIVTNAYLTGENASGSVRTLPKYLWLADFDDSYPDDAAWYYRQPQDYGHCSSVRDGNTYSRNLDWKFNSMAEVIIRMSAGQGRFASLGVANVGTNLTEEILASGAPTRYVKALPGHTVDGINERGVVCNVNVVDGQITGWNGGDIHPLGAVRWVLDHATSALDAATNLAARIGFPQGWTQNFHWMIADETSTYIVENGDFKKVTGRAVMTNFPLIDRVDGTGLERYNLLMSPTANITNAWWTLAYLEETSPRRYSDLETTDESVVRQIFDAWALGGRESHRGQTFGNKTWWQTVHTTVYDISNRVMRISVQEKNDWYTFKLPAASTDENKVREIAQIVADAKEAVIRAWVEAKNYVTQAWILAQNFATQAWVLAQNFATQAWVLAQNFATQQQLEETTAIVYTWEQFLDGSNVVFSITNYISGTYTLETAKLKIMEMRGGQYHEVYNSRDEIILHLDNFSNKYVRVAIDRIADEVAQKLAKKADKDWGKYTSAGGTAPSNTVYMTAPNTVFAGGMEYQRVAVGEGSICVLTTKGAPVWTVGDEGTFKFQDDGGTNYFGFAKSDSYTIGCNCDGIQVGSDHVVRLVFDITMSGVPCIWYKPTLENYSQTTWEQLNLPDGTQIPGSTHLVTWEENPEPGTQVCYINVTGEPRGFFKATVEVAGSAKFMTNMPADLSGGIMCTDDATKKVKAVWNGGSPKLMPLE